MRYAGTDRDDEGPWFRIGQLEVTTTIAVLVLWAVTLLAWTLEPVDKPFTRLIYLDGELTGNGELWRIFTWPWAHAGFDGWTVIDAAIFGFFGIQLERMVRKGPMAGLLATAILSVGVATAAYSLLLPGEAAIADLRLLELTVVLLFCAEYPNAPFFFGVPAWAVGGVIVAVEVINDLSYRYWIRLLVVLTAAVVVTLVAKVIGLLGEYDRVPDLSRGRERTPKPPKPAKKATAGGGLGSKLRRQPEAEIVEMPTAPRRPAPPVVVPDDVNADDLALDALLDKISAGGMDSLTDAERAQLEAIRERRGKRD